MLKKRFLLLIYFLLTNSIFGGVDLNIDIGYGIPLGKVTHSAEVDAIEDSIGYIYSKYDDKYNSFGNGIKYNMSFIIYLNDNIGVIIKTGFSFLGGFKINSTYNNFSHDSEAHSNFFFGNIGLKIKSEIRKIIPYISICPGIYIPVKVEATLTDQEPGFRIKLVQKYKFTPGFGFEGCIGTNIMLTNNFGFNIGFEPSYAFARVKEIEWELTDLEDGTIESGKITYQVDSESLPVDSGNNTYKHGGNIYSFSSFNMKLGIVCSF